MTENEREGDLLTPLVGFSVLALLVFIGAANRESPDIFTYTLFTSAFLISSWVCLVAVEKSTFTKWLWSFRSTTVVTGFLISAFIFYASMRSSALINEVFLIDSSALVYTKTIGYVLFAFSLFAPLFLTYLGISLIVLIKQSVKPTEHACDNSWMKTIIFFINGVILGLIGGPLSSFFWNEERYKEKLEEIADFADFGSHSCLNIEQSLKVIFLGASQREVLVKFVEREYMNESKASYIRAKCISDSENKKILPKHS